MKKNKDLFQIRKRKQSHLTIAILPESQIGDSGFSKYKFEHNALPEIDFDQIDTSTTFLGRRISFPLFISCMTGGVTEGEKINSNLAKAAQKLNIPMGVGSQRIAVDHPQFKRIFQVRKFAPDIPILANMGLVQLNYGYGIKEIKEIIKMVDASAIVFHLNPIQEVVQPEGNRNFERLLPKLMELIPQIPVPVIIKEVGFGLSYKVIDKLYSAGVRFFDVAGWGGTNWSFVEGKRHSRKRELGELFSEWGIPTTETILGAVNFKNKKKDQKIVILGSGGVRSGIDIAKGIAMGADLMGVAAPFAKAALTSSSEVADLIAKYQLELKVAMFGVGAKDIGSLRKVSLNKV